MNPETEKSGLCEDEVALVAPVVLVVALVALPRRAIQSKDPRPIGSWQILRSMKKESCSKRAIFPPPRREKPS